MSAPDSVELRYRVAPGYYMYRERFGITISPYGAATLGEAVYPKGEVKYDPTFEKDMEVYHQDVIVRVPVQPGGQAFTLTATSQGCADAGLCYPPMDHSVKLTPCRAATPSRAALAGAGEAASAGASAGGLGGLLSAGDTGLADALGGLGWAKTAGVFLVLGLLLAFTPCVLPMIPILSSIVVGGTAPAPSPRADAGWAWPPPMCWACPSCTPRWGGRRPERRGPGRLAADALDPEPVRRVAGGAGAGHVRRVHVPDALRHPGAPVGALVAHSGWALHRRAADGRVVGPDRRALRGRAAGRRCCTSRRPATWCWAVPPCSRWPGAWACRC